MQKSRGENDARARISFEYQENAKNKKQKQMREQTRGVVYKKKTSSKIKSCT